MHFCEFLKKHPYGIHLWGLFELYADSSLPFIQCIFGHISGLILFLVKALTYEYEY